MVRQERDVKRQERDVKMGKVLQLHQRGKGGWEATRGRIYKAIMEGAEFKTGAMKGEKDKGYGWGWDVGRLDVKYRASVQRADYVIYSYSTPIAWHIPWTQDTDVGPGKDVWVIPDESYSRTTSRHQGTVQTALVFAKVLPYDVDPSEGEGC